MKLKVKLSYGAALLGAIFTIAALIPGNASGFGRQGSSSCRWCGAQSYGRSCPYSPQGFHEHVASSASCEFCGAVSYGKSCPYPSHKTHRHGHGSNKCRWCGSTAIGRSCPYSPQGTHER